MGGGRCHGPEWLCCRSGGNLQRGLGGSFQWSSQENMNTLRKRLAAIVAEARFDLEYTEVRGDGTRTRRDHRALSSQELASAYTSQRDRIGGMRTDCHVTDDTMESLIAEVRTELSEFICPQSGHLGHAFPIGQNRVARNSGGENGVSHLEYESTPKDFAMSLLQAAAIVGVDKTTELLAAWRQGEPVRFSKSTVVNGVVVNDRYVPRQDIEIVALPLTTDELPRLPDRDRMVPSDYLGRTLVSLQASASPALFCPRQDDKGKTATTRTKGRVGFDTLCDALSLQANSHVSWTFVWTEHGDADPFCLRDWTIVGDERFEHLMWKSRTWMEAGRKPGAVSIERGEYVSTTMLDESKLLSMIEDLQGSDKKLRIAVERWKRSMRPNSAVVDRLIELRIALEALYLKDFTSENSQEMRFRLALIGAWHLGETFARRQQIRKVLRDAYDKASGAVHTGEAPVGAISVLKEAQKLCREGILKLLREGPPADWGNLILGPDQ